jgi:transcriptional regulator with XRE-family HTH domain
LEASQSIQPFLGAVVRTLRSAEGWSQEELASKAKIYSNQVSLLERAERTVTVPILEKVAEALDLECDQLLWMARMLKRRVEREESKR